MKEESEIKKQTLCVVMRKYIGANSEIHAEPLLIVAGFGKDKSCDIAKEYVFSLNLQRDKLKKYMPPVEESPYKPLDWTLEMLKEAITWGDTVKLDTEFYVHETRVL